MVAVVIDPRWASHLLLVAPGRDCRASAAVPDQVAKRMAVITAVADDPARNLGQAREQCGRQRQFMRLTRCQHESNCATYGVGDYASLGSIAAARSAKRLTHIALCRIAPFFAAPAAF